MFLTLFVLAFLVSLASGFLGIGGGIILAPTLLYAVPILGQGSLCMKQVSGLTITQSLVACLFAAALHARERCLDRRLVAAMAPAVVVSSFCGGLICGRIPDGLLKMAFAAIALLAGGLMLVKARSENGHEDGEVSIPAAAALALLIGFAGGMIGQGGSFILIPAMIFILKVPTRRAIGSNLAIVFAATLAGVSARILSEPFPWSSAAAIALGAIPGALIGSRLSARARPAWLRRALGGVILVGAAAMAWDAWTTLESAE